MQSGDLGGDKNAGQDDGRCLSSAPEGIQNGVYDFSVEDQLARSNPELKGFLTVALCF